MEKPKTIVDVFNQQVERYDLRAALRVKKGGRYVDISWREWGERVRHFSLGLMCLGMKRGDHISLLSHNRPEFAIADLAILSAGAVTVPIYPTSVADDVAYIFNHSEARLLIADRPNQLEKIESVRSALPRLEKVILIEGGEFSQTDWVIGFEAVCQLGQHADEEAPPQRAKWQAANRPDDVATIIYTSGTTGRPKGVMIAHGNIMFVCHSLEEAFRDYISDENVYLSYLPLAHALERMGLFMQIYMGSTICFAESLETVGENIGEVCPTSLVGVPRFYEKIRARILNTVEQGSPIKKKIFSWALPVGRAWRLAQDEGRPVSTWLALQYAVARRWVFDPVKARLGGRAQYCLSGAAPLSQAVAEFFADLGLVILEGYGATEVCGPATLNRVGEVRIGTVGPPIPGVEIKIAEDGEILICGGNVFKGYFKDRQATHQALQDGWYHSGDVGHLDEAGRLVITDRKKDLIITSGGKNIAPQKLENFFKTCEYINQIIVVGDRRHYLTALITLNPEAIAQFAKRAGLAYQNFSELAHHPQVRALLERCMAERNAQLASFEQIKKFSILDEEFTVEGGTLTPTMKIKRKVAMQKYAHVIEAMYRGSNDE
jgi:long-chain acyl-CoA synthetase